MRGSSLPIGIFAKVEVALRSVVAAAVLAVVVCAGCAAPPDERSPLTPAMPDSSGVPGPPSAGPPGPVPSEPLWPPEHPSVVPDASGPPMMFGLDVESLPLQQDAGLHLDYGTIWIGVWNLDKGWLVPEARLRELRQANVTPAVQFYYWGDDLAPSCFEQGCNGKTVAGWDRLAQELVDRLDSELEGGPVLLVLETEFNKGSVARLEPLDALLAEKATWLRSAYPSARIVLGFGDWNLPAWETWDRAAAASDAVGLQAMTGSEVSRGVDPGLFSTTLEGVKRLRDLFGKPVILSDVAVPSAPEPATPANQASTLDPFLDGIGELKAAGVEAILYRSLTDAPGVPLDNYFGEAERHFGLATAEGLLKPAGHAWAAAMRAERGAGRSD